MGAFSRHPYPSSARLPPSSPAVALASRDMRWNGWAVCKPFLLSFSSFAVFMLSYFSITFGSPPPPSSFSSPSPFPFCETKLKVSPSVSMISMWMAHSTRPNPGSPLHTRVVFKQKIRLAASTFFAAHASGVYVRRFWKPGNNMKQPVHEWFENRTSQRVTAWVLPCRTISRSAGLGWSWCRVKTNETWSVQSSTKHCGIRMSKET